MSKTNWKALSNPLYLGSYSLDDGAGKYTTIKATISYVKVENVTGSDGKKEDCAVAYFKERNLKPMILNTTNMKTLEKLLKSKYIEDWANRSILIGVESVKAFGDVVDALRIKKTLPQGDGPLVCVDCGEVIADTTTEKGVFKAAQIVAISRKKYGEDICVACLNNRKAAEEAAAEAEAAEKAAAEQAAEVEQEEIEETEGVADAVNE